MLRWPGSWRWLQSRLVSRQSRTGRPVRRRRFDSFGPPVAAEVETLESRALLTVTYHGGALLPHVETQAVFLGSQWATSSSLQTQETQINQYLATIVNSSYMDMLTNAGYNVGRGTSAAGATDNLTLNTTTGITDAQIQADLQSMITAGKVQAADANRLYVVYVEPGVVVHLGSDASNTTFLGYHGAFAGKNAAGQAIDIHYVVMPYPGAPNFSPASQGFSSLFNELTAVTSHELAEAVTDPNVNYKTLGWYDDFYNGEIGDLAQGYYSTVGGYLVQDVVNQQDQIISPATTPPPPPVGLSAPTLSASATSSTTAHLTWTAVSGASGYKVYWINGSQQVLLGTVGSATTAVNISGLTPGASESFMVAAYNSTSVADSNVATIKMPVSQGLAAPQLEALALSSSTALLAWNSVSGASGYRVYVMVGTQQLLLGTVGASTTAVEVTGMSPGTSYKFMVEAFNATSKADSAWVSLTTLPFARPADMISVWASFAQTNPAGPSQWIGNSDPGHHHRFV